MKWFTYHQNNSGGFVIRNDDVTDAVIIQANNVDEANDKMYDITSDYGEYCPCCGFRWEDLDDEDDGFDVPSWFGRPITDKSDYVRSGGYVIIYHANGNKEFYYLKRKNQ